MIWYGLQLLIVFAVVASNAHWQWAPNPVVAGILGGVAAIAVTYAAVWLMDEMPSLRRRKRG